MYSRIINGNEHTFGVSGKLIRNALVMYDRETETLWSQLLGEAVQGSLVGTRLEHLPAVMITWSEWKEMHPDTRALQKGYVGVNDPYEGYYQGTVTGVIGVENLDDRLKNKEFVIGVDLNGLPVAYPFSVLDAQPVVSDDIGGTPIVVVFDPESTAGAVWNRTLEDGSMLEFVAHRGTLIRDIETGSLWNGLTGLAIDGELTGTVLKPVANTQVFWFAWVDFHPDTAMYGLP